MRFGLLLTLLLALPASAQEICSETLQGDWVIDLNRWHADKDAATRKQILDFVNHQAFASFTFSGEDAFYTTVYNHGQWTQPSMLSVSARNDQDCEMRLALTFTYPDGGQDTVEHDATLSTDGLCITFDMATEENPDAEAHIDCFKRP